MSVGGESERRRVLVVDDNPDALAALCELVESWGYDVDAAEDGWHAFEMSRQHAPDIIITDMSLPDAGACDVIRSAKTRRGTGVFVIAYTGWHHLRATAMAAGADAFVLKPEIDELERLLRCSAIPAADRKATG